MGGRDIDTVVMVNNAVSVDMARAALQRDGVELQRIFLVLLRDLDIPWARECGEVVRYPSKPSLTVFGQGRFLPFYLKGSKELRSRLNAGLIRQAYIVNNDNLLSNHLLRHAEKHGTPEITVVAEGIMNFQDIRKANRAAWRWWLKPLAARLLGLRYQEPTTHLSGAYEPTVSRVIAFTSGGLKAPAEKVEVVEYPQVQAARAADPDIALIPLTGLFQWMPEDAFEPYARAFAAWVGKQGFARLLVKRHPHYPAGLIEELLPDCEWVGEGQSLEAMAGDLEAGTVLGTCCTGLVTLKLIRPELRCMDFGSDYYCQHAYGGDTSVETLMTSVGVELVPMLSAETADGT